MGIETLMVALAAAVGAYYVSSTVALRRREAAAVGAVVAGIVVATGSFFAADVAAVPDGQPVVSARDDFVGSGTCRSCHQREHTTWGQSYHSRMTQKPTVDSIIPAWTGTIDAGRMSADLIRKGDEFWVRTPDLDTIYTTPDSDKLPTLPKIERQIVLVTGSHHKQIYWYATGREQELEIFPFLWLLEESRWVPRDAAFLRPIFWPPRSERGRWNDACISCHTTAGRPRFADEEGNDPRSDAVDFGIACESCHGPGRVHQELHKRPWKRYAAHIGVGPNDDIVNPKKLPADRGAEVCGQCHSTWIFTDDGGWQRNNDNGHSYNPGDVLREHIHVIDARESPDTPRMKRALHYNPKMLTEAFWGDGMIKAGGREYSALLATACFTEGEGDRKLQCTHCHAMHREADDDRPVSGWADDQLAQGMRGDDACATCHKPRTYATEAHTHHPLSSAGSRCQNCHMPHATYTLLKMTRNHMISIPSAATAVTTGRPDACSLCHLDKPMAWTAQHLNEWYGMPIPELSDDHKRIPASVVWGLTGDAVQRAIVAWNMGWSPAHEASGTDWLPLVLIQRLVDPYAAVRFIAARSLRTLPGFAGMPFDYIAARKDFRARAQALFVRWSKRSRPSAREDTGLMYKGRVRVTVEDFERLLESRDDTDVSLPE